MPILSLVASIAVALAAMGAPDLSPRPQAPESIRVVSTSHEVFFPDEIVFSLDAEAPSQITRVTFFYRLAGRTATVYGFPEFVLGTHVSAQFRLRTGGTSYLPSGIELRYYYVIEDVDGNSLESEEFSLQYRDPSFNWREQQEGALLILSHDIPASRVKKVAAKVNDRLEQVKDLFGLEDVPTMKAVILNSRLEANRSFPRVSEAASRGHLYAGFAFRDFGMFVVVGLNADPMIHEMTHLLLHEAVDSPLARVPAWLNEGLAMYYEKSSNRRESTVASAAGRGALMRLRAMNTVPGRPEDVRLFYAQSWSVVAYIVDTFGKERMTSLLSAIDSGSRIDEAVPAVYGLTLEELESRWRADVVKAMPLAPRPDIGTVGVSALITGAIVIALVVSGLGWVSRRLRRSESSDEEA